MFLAERSASMTRGSDLDLREDVLDELEWDPSIDARTIGVGVENGIIALTGHVASYADKVNAERIAKRVQGVAGVANKLEVRVPAARARSDEDIARSAANALDWDVEVPTECIKAGVSDGWVTLDGEVEWYYQKMAAENAVRNLAGVRGVSNKVLVKTHAARVADVKEKIEAALKRNAEVDAKRIAVYATDGTVTLTGTVRSWVEREDAVNAAWSAPGVTEVIDHIAVHA
jgi:osmotically-inducible protein OsmY